MFLVGLFLVTPFTKHFLVGVNPTTSRREIRPAKDMAFRGNAELVEECVVPDTLHAVSVGDNAVVDREFHCGG